MKKYTPRVAQIIRAMQNGSDLMSHMVLTRANYISGLMTYGRVVTVGRVQISPQAADAVFATKDDLVVSTPRGDGGYDYELTERGRTIVLDDKGQEMPAGWTPKPRPEPPFPCMKLGLLPSINVLVACRNKEDWKRFFSEASSQVEPVLQIPSPLEEFEWALRKEGKRVSNAVVAKKKVKGRVVRYYESYEVVSDGSKPPRCLEFAEFAREFLNG